MEDPLMCDTVADGEGPKAGMFGTASTTAGELSRREGETITDECMGEEESGEFYEEGGVGEGEGADEEQPSFEEGDYQGEYLENSEENVTQEQAEGLNSPCDSSSSSRTTLKTKKQMDNEQKQSAASGKWGYTQMKLIIYGCREVCGKGLYCKFYHARMKHKTTPRREKNNPVWNEWFPISHAIGIHSPVLTISLWGSNLTGHSKKGFFEVDVTSVLEGEMLDDYFPLEGCNGEIRVKLLLMGASAWELIEAVQLSSEQVEAVDKIHQIFPSASYSKIASAFRCHQHCSEQTIAYLKTLSVPALSRDLGSGSCREGMQLSLKEREECIEVILRMTPDVSSDEIRRALIKNDFVITAAVDELVRMGRTKRTEESLAGSPAYQLRKVESIANTGGFISQIDQRTGEERILHQSVLRQGCSGLGRIAFDERRLLFEDRKQGGRQRSRPMRVPTQGEI
eukprot:GHVS01022590.1.p1 GENE.GHVS01022590.1~~GHVS01022590.1.p1  ORF type:complete len:510 (+),score=65.21 GHVS01022590.1:171-1532(+)